MAQRTYSSNRTSRTSSSRSKGKASDPRQRYIRGTAAYDYAKLEKYREKGREKVVNRKPPMPSIKGIINSLIKAAMLGILVLMLLYYVSLSSWVTQADLATISLATEISELRTKNDQRLKEVKASINLDEIKYIAITELGMHYASEDQVITYTNRSDDYVRQIAPVEP